MFNYERKYAKHNGLTIELKNSGQSIKCKHAYIQKKENKCKYNEVNVLKNEVLNEGYANA
jgi:hypothetical protein